jgi:hypothetical protein
MELPRIEVSAPEAQGRPHHATGTEEDDMKAGSRNQHPATGETLGHRRLLSRAIVAAAGLIGAVGFASAETQFAGGDDLRSTITVQIYNYSQASPAVLTGAEREAGRILGAAGVRAVWLECPVWQSTASPQGRCQKAFEATDISLRVLAAPIQNKSQDNVFGFTVHPVLASVYYEYALRLAMREGAEFEVPIILGCFIAHELGHLLLGPNSHSASGIMQGKWQPKQFHLALTGRLLFASQQANLIRAEARRRMDRKTGIPEAQRLATVDLRAEPMSLQSDRPRQVWQPSQIKSFTKRSSSIGPRTPKSREKI